MLLNKINAESAKPKKSKVGKAISFIAKPFTRSKKQEVPRVEQEVSIPKTSRQLETEEILKEFEDVMPQNSILDLHHLDAIGQQSPKAIERKELSKKVHEELHHFDEGRMLADIESKLLDVAKINSKKEQAVLKYEVVPALVEDIRSFGLLEPISLTAAAQKFSKWNDGERLSFAISIVDKLIRNQTSASSENKANEKIQFWNIPSTDRPQNENKAIYEKIKNKLIDRRVVSETRLKVQKFLAQFSPETKKILKERVLPNVLEEYDITLHGLFSENLDSFIRHIMNVLDLMVNKDHMISHLQFVEIDRELKKFIEREGK